MVMKFGNTESWRFPMTLSYGLWLVKKISFQLVAFFGKSQTNKVAIYANATYADLPLLYFHKKKVF